MEFKSKLTKKITRVLFIFALLIFLSQVPAVYAADITVTCADEGLCTTSPGGGAALFEQQNFLPGESISGNISVTNNDKDDDCDLTLDTLNETSSPEDFPTKLFTVIKNGAADLFGIRDGANKASSNKNLEDLFTAGPVFLDTVPPGGTQSYDWTITFDPQTPNSNPSTEESYQGGETNFDFDMVFECGAGGPASTPTPTPTPTTASGGGGGGGGAGVGGAGGGCSDAVPSAPTGLSASFGVNSAILTWTEPSETLTTYYILYGTSPGVYTFGSLSIGGPGTTNYTVTNLTGGTTYYFVVGAINGCAPGPYSNEAVATPTGGAAAGLPPGFAPFAPGTLGVATEAAELVGEEKTGEELGVTGEAPKKENEPCIDPWWWILVFLAQVILHLWIYRKADREDKKGGFLAQAVVALLSVVVFLLFFCARWYIYPAVIIGIIAVLWTYNLRDKLFHS